MKATGVIRRIDDLGRIVIPKEIRKNLRLRDGDNLEVYIKDDQIMLKKFSIMNRINDLAQELTDAMYTIMKHSVFITDTNKIIAVSGPLRKEFIGQEISNYLINSINRREKIIENHFKELNIIENNIVECSYIVNTIYANGEPVGLILIINETEKLGESELQMSGIISSFITKYLEQ